MDQTRETELLLPITSQDNCGLIKLLRSVGHTVTRFFTSGRLLNVLTFVIGLRDPRKAGFWAVVFMSALVVTDFGYELFSLLFNVICPKIDYEIEWFCVDPNTINGTDQIWDNESRIDTNILCVLRLIVFLGPMSSNYVFFFALLKLDKGENTIKPVGDVFELNNRPLWLQTNILLVLSGLALISTISVYSHILVVDYFLVAFGALVVWRNFVNCCLFGMLMMALNDCVKKCEIEIKNLCSDELDDAIAIHQNLCAQVFSTSDSLKLWFIINWITPVFWGAFYIVNFRNTFHSWDVSYINTWFICSALFMFLYPCYSAASVTNKCRQILIDMNMTKKDDWSPGHPFKQRGQLLQFIQYADYTQCGFRVGSTVFGTNYAWISTLLALLAGAVRLLYST